MRTPVTVAVVALVITAGCGGLSTGGGGDARTVNPGLVGTPSPTASPTPAPEYPPGVHSDGVDGWILANAHQRTLTSAGATARTNRTITSSNGTTLGTVRTTVALDDERIASAFVTGGADPSRVGVPIYDFALWSDGERTAIERARRNGEAEYTSFTGPPPESLVAPGMDRESLYRVFMGVNVSVVDTGTDDGERVFRLRGDADRVERVGGPTLLNYSIVASVTEEGVVRSYRVQYREERARAGVVTIEERFRVTGLGNTTVERPEWVERALDEADGEGGDGNGEGGDGNDESSDGNGGDGT